MGRRRGERQRDGRTRERGREPEIRLIPSLENYSSKYRLFIYANRPGKEATWNRGNRNDVGSMF
jgi:hypothetical protein